MMNNQQSWDLYDLFGHIFSKNVIFHLLLYFGHISDILKIIF